MAHKKTQVEHMKYFQEEVTPTLEDLMMALMVEQPANPVPSMIRHLIERTKAPAPTSAEQKQLSLVVSSLQAEIAELEAQLEAVRSAAPSPPEPPVIDTEVADRAEAAPVSDGAAEIGLGAIEGGTGDVPEEDPLEGLPTPKDIAEAAVKAEAELFAASKEPTVISEMAPSDPLSAEPIVDEEMVEGDVEAAADSLPEAPAGAEEGGTGAAGAEEGRTGAASAEAGEVRSRASSVLLGAADDGSLRAMISEAAAGVSADQRVSADAPSSKLPLDQPETSSSNVPRGGRRGGRRRSGASPSPEPGGPFADDAAAAAAPSGMQAVASDEQGIAPKVLVQAVDDGVSSNPVTHFNSSETVDDSPSLKGSLGGLRRQRGLAAPARSREPSAEPGSAEAKPEFAGQSRDEFQQTDSQATSGGKPRGGRRGWNPFKGSS